MSHDPLFDTDQNRALLVICARRSISNVGIGGIIWGVINLGVGIVALRATSLNFGLVLLGLLMLIAGINAIARPSLRALLAEAIVSVLLLVWNIGITVLNARAGDTAHVNGHGLIYPAVAAFLFFRQYQRLGHLKQAIHTMDAETVKQTAKLCKDLFRQKIKLTPDIAEAAARKVRVKFMTDSVFCVQRDLQRAFSMGVEDFRKAIKDINAKKLQLTVNHPLGKLTYAFDKANSEKIKGWLAAKPLQPA